MKENKIKKPAVDTKKFNICSFYLQESFWILITLSTRYWFTCKTIFWPVTFLVHSLYYDLRREKDRSFLQAVKRAACVDAQPCEKWQASEFLLHWLPHEYAQSDDASAEGLNTGFF